MKFYHGTAHDLSGDLRPGDDGVIYCTPDWDVAWEYAESSAYRGDGLDPTVWEITIDGGAVVVDVDMPEDQAPGSMMGVIAGYPDADVIVMYGVSQGGDECETQVAIRDARHIAGMVPHRD